MSSEKVQVTKNYRLFHRSADNRRLDLKKHKNLMESMKLYGFLKSFPLSVVRDSAGRLIVKDGQHRLAIAEVLGLPVYWILESVDYSTSTINCTAKTWNTRDYAEMHAANGIRSYQDGLEFADLYRLPVSTAFALLAGTTSHGNIAVSYIDGSFKIKDRPYAEAVAGIYKPLCDICPAVRNTRLLEACMAVCRVEGFDPKRLVSGAERCREKLVAYSTRDGYLDMLEEIYNFGRKQLVSLKIAAQMAMRDRSAINKHTKGDK